MVPVIVAVLLVLAAIGWQFFGKKPRRSESGVSSATEDNHNRKEQTAKAEKPVAPAGGSKKQKEKKEKLPEFSHPLLFATLKGHQSSVTQVSFDASGTSSVATVSEDRTLRVWDIKHAHTNANIPFARNNISGDHASSLGWSPDGGWVCVALERTKEVHVFSISHKDGKVFTKEEHSFATKHKRPISSVIVGHNLSFIITCADGDDTKVYLHGPKGKVITEINTNQLENHTAAISPDHRFLAIGTRMGDVRVWEFGKNKAGEFTHELTPVMQLRGHKRGVRSLQFSSDSTKVITASLDGQWRVFNIAVRYSMSEDPKIVQEHKTEFDSLSHVAMSDSHIAVACGSTLQLFSVAGNLLHTIEGAHDRITSLSFSKNGKVLASAGTERLIRVWAADSPYHRVNGKLLPDYSDHAQSAGVPYAASTFASLMHIYAVNKDNLKSYLWKQGPEPPTQ